MSSLSLYAKIESLPPALKKEALAFIEYLLRKTQKKTFQTADKKPIFGSLKGKIHLADDFDAPLDVFKAY
jgi:hypothetical protein